MSTKSSDNGRWSYITGEKGRNRVRVFAWTGGIWIDYKDAGTRHRKPLGHSDRLKAKRLADDVASQLGSIEQRLEAAPAALRLAPLFDMYEREVTPTKAPGSQGHDRRAMAMAGACWGGETLVTSLDRRHWDRFIQQRRQGALGRGKARDGVIRNNLQLIVAVMHWAETVKVAGQPLLLANPFKGFPLPIEENPSQPVLTEAEVVECFRAAPKVNRHVPLFLALAYETAKRCFAISRLRVSDIDLAKSQVRWRAEFDKTRTEHVAPISKECAAALKKALRERRAIGDAWLFPHHKRAGEPMSKYDVNRWWRRLEVAAGIARVRHRGWHSCRRTMATDLAADGASLKTIMEIIGWKRQDTALQYIHPTESDQRAALKTRRRANAG